MKKEDVKNKEDYINFILLELYNKVHPVVFGDFFMELSPAGGIDNFRDLLDELYSNQLVTRKSEDSGSVPGMPHLKTIDLRYGISLKGIEHLKNNQVLIEKQMKEKDVFVTYSWDNEEHNDKVLSFTNFLRDKGFIAEVDKLVSQKESATDFYKMMHQAMTDYKKVIIVLSKGYKEKANSFKGGVGTEYSLIIKDIEENTNKYILVSFDEISNAIAPLNLQGRHIIDLSDKGNLNELFAKLMDEEIIEFSEIGAIKPLVNKKKIKPFELEEKNIEIVDLISTFESSSTMGQLLTMIEFQLSIEIKNESTDIFEDYNIEVHYPINTTDYTVDGKIEPSHKIVTYENTTKLFPHQGKSIELENIIIRNYTAEDVLNSFIKVKMFTKKGLIEKEFLLNKVLKLNSDYGQKELTVEDFQEKNYR